jgi:hypothetical protein
VGLLDRFRRHVASPPNVAEGWIERQEWRSWEAPRNVVVESFYQEALHALCGGPCEAGYLIPVQVELRREPGNPHDRNAIAAYLLPSGRQIGHIRREIAASLGPVMDKLGIDVWRVAGVARGGRPRAEHIGVHLWVGRRLSAGPGMSFDPGLWEVPWPPGDRETDRAITILAGPPT